MLDYSLSVIIPNYNKSSYLETCVNSILNQTLLPNEIIIVDDCSSDDSVEKMEKLYGNNNLVKIVALKENGGVSNARNVGAEQASSAYITFIDSDDFYYGKDKLKLEMGLIKRHKEKSNKDVIAYSAMVRCGEDGVADEYFPLAKKYYTNGKAYRNFLASRKILLRDYCMKKEFFLSVGGYSYPKNFYEDLDLLIRLSKVSSFYFTEDYGTAYRRTPSGLSKRSPKEHEEEIRKIIKSYLNQESLLFKINNFFLKIEWKFRYRILRLMDRIFKKKTKEKRK